MTKLPDHALRFPLSAFRMSSGALDLQRWLCIQLTALAKNDAKASFWNEEIDVSLNSRQQTLTALPEWSRFLQSIYCDAEEIENIAISQGAIDGFAGKQTVALNVRRFQDMVAGKRYPVADTVWNLCAYMRPHGFFGQANRSFCTRLAI